MPRRRGWIGAAISVDGQVIGTMIADNAQSVEIPLGRHIVQVEKAGRTAVKHELMVPDATLRQPPEIELP